MCSCCSNVLYNPDLLKEKVTASVTSPPRNVEAQLPSREVIITPAPTPFYRTNKGVIIIAVAVSVVIIAAVVGGVVGGTKHKNSSADQTGAVGTTQQGGSTLPAVASSGLPTLISTTQPVRTTAQGQQSDVITTGLPASTGSNSHATTLSTVVSTLTITITSQPLATLTSN